MMDWVASATSLGAVVSAFARAVSNSGPILGAWPWLLAGIFASVLGLTCCVAGCALGWAARGALPELLQLAASIARRPEPPSRRRASPPPSPRGEQLVPKGYRLG